MIRPGKLKQRNSLKTPLTHVSYRAATVRERFSPRAAYTRLNTSAEFLLPNAMQLATACSICSLRPGLGM